MLIDHLKGKLPPNLEAIAQDMLASYGERLGMKWGRKGGLLTAHLEQGGSPMRYTMRQIQIGDRPSCEIIDLKDVPEELAVTLYTRPWKQLPQEMRIGSKRARLYLPPEGEIWPVGHGGFGGRFIVGGFVSDWASRGVRSASAASVTQKLAPSLDSFLDFTLPYLPTARREQYEAKLKKKFK